MFYFLSVNLFLYLLFSEPNCFENLFFVLLDALKIISASAQHANDSMKKTVSLK